MAIDKITAGILYSHGYKLQDSEGNVWEINSIIGESHLSVWNNDLNKNIFFDQIGTTYKILARDLEQLTQEIDGKVPLVECARIAMPDKTDFYIRHEDGGFLDDGWLTTFYYKKGSFICNRRQFKNQLSLFKRLYEWKMDVENLIGRGLAIDVNTLPVNPYL